MVLRLRFPGFQQHLVAAALPGLRDGMFHERPPDPLPPVSREAYDMLDHRKRPATPGEVVAHIEGASADQLSVQLRNKDLPFMASDPLQRLNRFRLRQMPIWRSIERVVERKDLINTVEGKGN